MKYLLILLHSIAFSQLDAKAYKETIAHYESGNNYKAYNKSSGACGKYQFIYKYIPKQYNCGSVKAFLNTPKQQDACMDWYMNKSSKNAQKIAKKHNVDIFIAMAYLHWQGIYANGSNLNKFLLILNKRFKYYGSIKK